MTGVRFHEEQRVTMAWVWILVGGLAGVAWVVFGGHLLFGLDLGSDPPPPWLAGFLLAVFGVGFPVLLASYRFETTVDDGGLHFAVHPLLHRSLPHRDIAAADAVRYRPLLDYLGWGVRWMPGRGWAFTVGGDRGVRVRERSGRAFLLGSRRPEELAAALGAEAGERRG